MKNGFRNTLVSMILLSFASTLLAGEPVTFRLNDGTRFQGEIADLIQLTVVRQGIEVELEGRLIKAADWYIQIEADVAGDLRKETIFKNDIVSIRTMEGEAAEKFTADVSRRGTTTRTARRTRTEPAVSIDQPGVFVLPLKGMVGGEFRHQEMRKIAKEADKYGDGQTIILLIDSGGGAVTEMETIHSTLTEIKKRHRLVAWIKKAISAACATAMHCDEIYFMSEGTAGAMTAFAGGQAWKDEKLEEWMRRAGDWMEQGGRSRYIAEAMIHAPILLSYDKDPVTGEVVFYNDLSGEFALSADEQNLVFTAKLALHCGFSDGTADTEEQLAELLDLPQWHEISDYGRRIAQEWQDTCEEAVREVTLLVNRLQYEGTGSGNPQTILQTRIKNLKKIIWWIDRAPNAVRGRVPPKAQIEREISELKKQLADMKKRARY